MEDLWNDILDTNGMTSASAEWNEFGFGSLCVQRARKGQDEVALVLLANNLEAARRGLDKYCSQMMAALQGWFDCTVWVNVCGPIDNPFNPDWEVSKL